MFQVQIFFINIIIFTDALLFPASTQQMSTDERKAALVEEKKALKKMIYSWTKHFIAKNQRDPTKNEKELLAKDMFRRYKMVSIVQIRSYAQTIFEYFHNLFPELQSTPRHPGSSDISILVISVEVYRICYTWWYLP